MGQMGQDAVEEMMSIVEKCQKWLERAARCRTPNCARELLREFSRLQRRPEWQDVPLEMAFKMLAEGEALMRVVHFGKAMGEGP